MYYTPHFKVLNCKLSISVDVTDDGKTVNSSNDVFEIMKSSKDTTSSIKPLLNEVFSCFYILYVYLYTVDRENLRSIWKNKEEFSSNQDFSHIFNGRPFLF